MKSKSICILTTTPGSIRVFYQGQIEALNKAGFKTTVICADNKKVSLVLSGGTDLVPIDFSRTIKPIQDIRVLWQLYKLFRNRKFGVIQYSTLKASLLGAIAAFCAKAPIRIYILWGQYYTGLTGIKRFVMKMVEKIICRLSTHVLPISHEMVDFIVKEGVTIRSKCEVMLNGSACGVDLEKFNPETAKHFRDVLREKLSMPANAVVIGTVARLTGDKGVNELVKAFDTLCQEIPFIFLLLVGTQEEKDRLHSLTEKIINENTRIRAVGWQPDPIPYYATMDIFCLPTYREGFGEVNLEAQAMCLPVVSTDVIGPRESVKNEVTGFLVEAKSSTALLEPLKKLAMSAELRKNMGKNGRERVKQMFDRNNMIKAVVDHRLKLIKEIEDVL